MTTIIEVDVRRQNWAGRYLPAGPAVVTIAGKQYTGKEAVEILTKMMFGQRVLAYIHGYNSAKDKVDAAYAQLDKGFDTCGLVEFSEKFIPAVTSYDVILHIHWPGGEVAGFHLALLRAVGFGDVQGADDRLHDLFIGMSPAALDFVAHSAGNLVLLSMNKKGDLPIRNMFLCAAAVNNDSICKGCIFYDAVSNIYGTAAVFVSTNDDPLTVYKYAMASNALGYSGPQYPDRLSPNTKVIPAPWSKAHSDFRNEVAFYAWVLQIAKGKAPGSAEGSIPAVVGS